MAEIKKVPNSKNTKISKSNAPKPVSTLVLKDSFEKLKEHFQVHMHSSVEFRLNKLSEFRKALKHYNKEIKEAIYQDFRKSGQETELTEIIPIYQEIGEIQRNLERWIQPRGVDSPLTLFGTHAEILHKPQGVVLILSSWNFPFQLNLVPMISAFSAGNTVLIKPSELTPKSNSIMKKIIQEVFKPEEVTLLEGPAKLGETLISFPFDHIFFSGKEQNAKKILKKKAGTICPITLELGSKCPAVIDRESDVRLAAERILWGKILNAGQSCVAPDTVYVHESELKDFQQSFKQSLTNFYRLGELSLKENSDYARIINQKEFNRLESLLNDSLEDGGKILEGGEMDSGSLFFSPTLIQIQNRNARIYKEEIQGPILVLYAYKELDEVIDFLKKDPTPLASYLFCSNPTTIHKFLANTDSGGVSINDVIIHLANPNLPFGGLRESGVRSYHGYYGFLNFTYQKSVLKQGIFSAIRLLYPPYNPIMDKVSDFMKKFMV
ncbi:MAG: aldehyde dehydrogenase family protein [Leptospiraceae bacterium]|nr:aldehyde dehydrogenase family protein [Leptospiraceae bacterium]MCP5511207.1 aldehyde dehydrogenase family protein [Leptospiraceae bacterium]